MTELHVRLLGRFEISCQGIPLSMPPTRKAQVLLTYLILQREHPQPRDRLAGLFWGDRPDEKARRSLSTALWHIIHCLPQQNILLSTSNTVQFNPRASLLLDTDEFTSLALRQDIQGLKNAVQIYRGEFLPGSYEDWIIHERYRLENLYLDVLGRLMAEFEAAQEYTQTLETAQRLLNLDPLREDAYRAEMRVYCLYGKRNTALEQYHLCRATLHQELGAEPMPDTSQLYQAILDGKYPPDKEILIEAQPLGREVIRREGKDPLELGVIPPLTGRHIEMSALEHLWKQALEGRGGLVVIKGEAGIGKTRLVEEFSRHLRWQGVPVLWGRCYEFERLLPYQPVAEALASLSPDMLLNLAGNINIIQEVTRIAPELANLIPGLIIPSGREVPVDQARLFKGITQLFQHIAQPNGMLLVMEDLHWVTQSTLEILHYLVRSLGNAPILVIATARIEALDRGHPLRAFQDQLKKEGLLYSLLLKRLTYGDVEELIAEMSAQGEAVLPLSQRMYQETEGNPFFLIECIKALFERKSIGIEDNLWKVDFDQISTSNFPLPASLSEAIHYRIDRLDEHVQQMASIAAVIGREFDFDLLAAAGGGNREQALQALDVLLRRQLIEEGSGKISRDYSFTHHKIQEVLYAELPGLRRREIHGLIGSILEQAEAKGVCENLGEIAYHFYHSRGIMKEYQEKAIHYLLQAGDQARMLYAHKEAIGYYNQGLELLEEEKDYKRTARVKMKLGVTYHTAFEYDHAHQAFEDGFQLWQAVSQPDKPSIPPAPHALRTNWPPLTSIDPALGMDFAGAVGWQLFSGLVAFSPELEVVPEAARKWQLYASGHEYVFQLKDNLQWSDGKPLTAYDFEFSGKRMLAPTTNSPFANLLFDVKGAASYHQGEIVNPDSIGFHALDEGSLYVELEKPTSYFLQLLANFLAVPRHCVEACGEHWTDPECIVTSGPFTLRDWRRDEYMLLEQNPQYHGQSHGNIQEVRLNLQPDPGFNLEKYSVGELDVLDMRFFPVGVFDNALRRFTDEYFASPAASLSFIGFNTDRPPFTDERVRIAFALAINKEMLANVILRGAVFPATGGFIPPGLPGHMSRIGLPYDPKRARRLLEVAGLTMGRGLREFQALTPLEPSDPISEYLSTQWKQELGIQVNWQPVSPGLHLLLETRPADLFLSFWHGDYPDPDDFLGASQILRWTGWRDEVYQNLLEETKSTDDQNRRLEIFQQADRYLMGKAAIVPITYNRQHFLFKPWVKWYPTSALFSWFWKDVVIDSY